MRTTNTFRSFRESFVCALLAVGLAACGGEMVGQVPTRTAPTTNAAPATSNVQRTAPPTTIEQDAAHQTPKQVPSNS